MKGLRESVQEEPVNRGRRKFLYSLGAIGVATVLPLCLTKTEEEPEPEWKKYPTTEVKMNDGSVNTMHYTWDEQYKGTLILYDENGKKHNLGRNREFALNIDFPIKLDEGDKHPYGLFNDEIKEINDEIASWSKYKEAVKLIEKSPEDYEFFRYWTEFIRKRSTDRMGSGTGGLITINMEAYETNPPKTLAEGLMHKAQHIHDANNIFYKKYWNNTFSCGDLEEKERRAMERQKYFLVRIGELSTEEAKKKIESKMRTRWWESVTEFGKECRKKGLIF